MSTPTPTPTPSPTPSPTPTLTPLPSPAEVTSAAQAAALVLASNPLFADIQPPLPDMVGQAAWYEASEVVDGYMVRVTVGWGDCQSGCIDRHNWDHHVSRDGAIELVGEDGPPPEVPAPVGGPGPANVTIRLLAGPICPVEQVPPDPNCALRAVAGAEVVVSDPAGNEIARGISDGAGLVALLVPGGAYVVQSQPVEGLMGTPEAQAFSVPGDGSALISFGYDTGIR